MDIFLSKKTNRKFSRMAHDQIHEQNNKDIKGVSGATDLFNRVDNSGLSRWELCSPDLARLVAEFVNNGDRNHIEEMQPHHEEKTQFQKTFFDDVQKTISAMQCNPFEIDKLTAVNNTNVHFGDHVYQSISKIELTGKEQCLAFIKKRLVNQEISIDNFSLPGCPEKGASKGAVASVMKINSTIITKHSSCVSYRRNEVSQIFSSEVDGVSQSLSINNDELYHGNKATLRE